MSEEKKPGPLTGLTPEQRLDRYATLIRWQTDDEIDVKKLDDQWDADERGVIAMIGQAKNNANLYNDLRRQGFEDNEFPDWWYSPERSIDEQPRPTSKKGEQTELKTKEAIALTPATPRIPAPSEEGPGRPPLRDQNDSDRAGSAESDLTQRESTESGFTRNEVDLLGSNGIVQGQDGV